MKGHWSRVNLVKLEALLEDLYATSLLPFPNANKKVYFNPYIYAKAMKIPKSRKNQCHFFRHVTCVFHWKIFATFILCFIAGECHEGLNINKRKKECTLESILYNDFDVLLRNVHYSAKLQISKFH